MKPTRTTNRLHFEDLEPSRFEDLCLAMVYRMNRWVEINHYGRSGSDEGIDIHAVEELEDGKRKAWFIQCKRWKKITKKELKDVADKAAQGHIPGVLLLVIACDIVKRNVEYFKAYANGKGIPTANIWTASILETKLYSEYHDLLFAYAGVSLTGEKRERVATIGRNIRLKQRMRKDFIKPIDDIHEVLKRPYKKFEHEEAIIHSINDTIYPGIDEDSVGISSWFKVAPYNFYHNGLEVILSQREAIFDEGGNWDIIGYEEPDRKGNYTKRYVWVIGRIPYENMIEYDLEGDEYYGIPHIYCDFKNNGEPYEEIVYSILSRKQSDPNSYDRRLDNKNRKKLE